MAYRRKGNERSATFVEDHRTPPGSPSSPATASPRATRFADDSRRPDRSSLAAQALLASAARGDVPALAERFPVSSSSSTRVSSSSSPRASSSPRSAGRTSDPAQDPFTVLYTSLGGSPLKKDEAKQGLWGILAQQAKVMLDENEDGRTQPLGTTPAGGIQSQAPSQSRWSYDRVRKSESPTFEKRAEAAKLDIGGKIKNAFEEGLTTMAAENRTAAVGGRKLQIRRKTCSVDFRSTNMNLQVAAGPDTPILADLESPQIKASRDVASAMAAKVKLLQRELKTVKANLAFSKERCAQLEEENRLLRDGNHDADEDLIRQQLETLLAEKARLANENTVYARENRFLREIVEIHQLKMQDVVLREDVEEEDGEEEEEGGAADAYRPGDDPWTLSSPLSVVQEEAEHMPSTPATVPQSPLCYADKEPEHMPATVPRSALCCTDKEPAAPGVAPQSPCHTDKVAVPKTDSEGAIHAESPMRRSFKDGAGSPETTPIRRTPNGDSCSPEMASDD